MKKSILFLEGKDDCIVISNLCEHRKVKENFKSIDCGSKEEAVMQFAVAINEQATTYKTVGIVIDADTDNSATWQQIKTKIELTGKYDQIPKDLPENGLILEANQNIYPRLGVWIMPNNKTDGMLEDFVVLLADNEDILMKETELVLHSLEDRKINKYKLVHRAKAKIHTYLAWQDKPGRPMGQAIAAHILNPNAKDADLFMKWIEELFGVNENTQSQ